MMNDQNLYNVGDLVKLSEIAESRYGNLQMFRSYFNKIGIVVRGLHQKSTFGAGYDVKFPNADTVFFIGSELELVRPI